VTVSRPGGLPAPLEPPERPHRRIPGWAKVCAAVAAVALIAVGNMAAKNRQLRAELAAADRVDAKLIVAAGEADDHAFGFGLLVVNRGRGPITVMQGRRVDPPVYDAMPWEDVVVGPGRTEQLGVRFEARCPGEPDDPSRELSLVVPIASSSGRVRDVRTPLDAAVMARLSRSACGYLTADEAAVPSVRGVTSTQYAVRFSMLLANVSDRRFELLNLTSPGLALSVTGGMPLAVAPHSNVDLAVAVALPACSRLPVPGPRGRGGTAPFGTITLVLSDAAEGEMTKPYVPNADLSAALAGLRGRICPRSLQGPSRSRGLR
jgi:hypothetical protein